MRRGRSLPSSLLLGLLIAGVAFAQETAQGSPGRPAKPAPQIAFEASALVASGLTPGDRVVWFGVEHRIDAEYSGEMAQRYGTGTVAADGTARFDPGHAVAPRSFWVAVDLDGGDFVVAAPNGYRLAKPQKPSRLGPGEGSKSDEILDERPYLMGLMVRPKEGAWAFAGGDGGPRDEDGKNDGHLRFALDKLDPLPGSPAAPARLQGDDLWFIVDPLTMEISVHKGGSAQ
jgi:hypothetical protein